jgi:hypothetical protein
MNKRRSIGILAIVACLLQGAALTHADPSLSTYFPLAIGNRWEYELVGRSDDPSEVDTNEIETWEITNQKEKTFTLHIFAYKERGTGFDEFIAPSSNGLQRITAKEKEKGKRDAQPRFFLKKPLEIGTRWENADGWYEITATDETITVPAGTFEHCIEVTNKSGTGRVTIVSIYAPGVGVVYRHETFPRPEGSVFDTRRKSTAILRLREWNMAEGT